MAEPKTPAWAAELSERLSVALNSIEGLQESNARLQEEVSRLVGRAVSNGGHQTCNHPADFQGECKACGVTYVRQGADPEYSRLMFGSDPRYHPDVISAIRNGKSPEQVNTAMRAAGRDMAAAGPSPILGPGASPERMRELAEQRAKRNPQERSPGMLEFAPPGEYTAQRTIRAGDREWQQADDRHSAQTRQIAAAGRIDNFQWPACQGCGQDFKPGARYCHECGRPAALPAAASGKVG